MTASASQHLKQAVNDAMVHASAGDYPAAIDVFLWAVAGHRDTAWIAIHDLTVPLLLVDCGDLALFRAALEGFDVADSRRGTRSTSRHLIGA